MPVKFQREGITYNDLSEEEKEEWDALEWSEDGQIPNRDRIANAKVTVLTAGKKIAEQQTGDDGKFSFDQLKAANYEIQVRV